MPLTRPSDHYLAGFEEWTAPRICEEVAWQRVMKMGWTPTPLLLMHLTKLVEEINDAELHPLRPNQSLVV